MKKILLTITALLVASTSAAENLFEKRLNCYDQILSKADNAGVAMAKDGSNNLVLPGPEAIIHVFSRMMVYACRLPDKPTSTSGNTRIYNLTLMVGNDKLIPHLTYSVEGTIGVPREISQQSGAKYTSVGCIEAMNDTTKKQIDEDLKKRIASVHSTFKAKKLLAETATNALKACSDVTPVSGAVTAELAKFNAPAPASTPAAAPKK